jgi:transposase
MMSKQLMAIPPIPRETERRARVIFGRKNFYILVGDSLESILEDIQAKCLLEAGVIPAQITIFQFLEGLIDDHAIEAVRTRLDWKFALHLPVYPPTLHESALCEFRQRVLNNLAYQHEFQKLIDHFVRLNPPLNNCLGDFNNLKLLSNICSINNLERVQAAMTQVLEALAVRFPEWLRIVVLPHWFGRYNHSPSGIEMGNWLNPQEFSIQEIAVDIDYLLDEIHRSNTPEISELQAVRTLEHIWQQQIQKKYQTTEEIPGISKWNDCDSCIYSRGGKWQTTI